MQEMQKAQELAQELGISMRTFYRRLDTGDIVGVDTVSGRRYTLKDSVPSAIRRAPHEASAPNSRQEVELKQRVQDLETEVELLKKQVVALVEWTEAATARINKIRK